MTEPDGHHEVEDFYASAHPIRRFVAGVTAIAVVLLAVWFTGLLAPRLSAQVDSGRHDIDTGRGVARMSISNDALLPIQVRAVQVKSDNVSTLSATVDGEPIASRPELPGSSTRPLVLEYEAGHCPAADPGPVAFMTIKIETPIGLLRQETLPITTGGSSDASPC